MKDIEEIYICAVRYALGRKTYITGVVSDYMMKHELSEHCKEVMTRDIEGADGYGDLCDKKSWMKLLTHLKTH